MALTIESIVKRLKEAQNNLNKSRINSAEKSNHSDAQFEYLYKNLMNTMSEEAMHKDDNTSVIAIVLFFYSLIIIVSIFGNCIVCKTVFKNSCAKSTINLYIGNLSISDLMMTGINIPLQLTEILIRNWPLGQFSCKCLHFIGSLTICVSTLTMTCIALDRFKVTAYPLKPRPSLKSTVHKIILIWITACLLSSPYAWISDVHSAFTYKDMIRCQLIYPDPKVKSRMLFTLYTLTVKFILPLTVAGITYFRICIIIWKRQSIGLITQNQKKHQREAKWKTIKMLLIVLIVFFACWSPRVIYLAYQDIRGDINYFKKHNSTIWFICHWFAMSSVCFNPFIYCWLNNDFQTATKEFFKCCSTIGKKKTQEPVAFLPESCNEELLLPGSSSNCLNKSSQKSDNMSCEEQSEQFYAKDMNCSQPKILQLSKTAAKVLINPSITVSINILKENTKTKRLQISKENAVSKKSEARTFV